MKIPGPEFKLSFQLALKREVESSLTHQSLTNSLHFMDSEVLAK